MNESQKRVVRFVGIGAIIGMAVGFCLPRGTNDAEAVLLPSLFGMMCGAIAAWFTGLR